MAQTDSNSSWAGITYSCCFCQLGMHVPFLGEGLKSPTPLTHTHTISFRDMFCLQFQSIWFAKGLPHPPTGTGMHPPLLHHSDGHLPTLCQWEPAPELWTETFRKEEALLHRVCQGDQMSAGGRAWRGSAWELGWHKDKWNKKLRTLVTSAEPWSQLYLKPDIALDFLVKKQWTSTHPKQSIN